MVQFPSDVLETIRVHLEEEKTKLTQELAAITSQDPFSNPNRGLDKAASDMEATDESSHDRFAAIGEAIKNKLDEIDGALSRIGDGTYGFCSICGNMIDTDRLAILPTAVLCLNHGNSHTV